MKMFFTLLLIKPIIFIMKLLGFSATNLPGNICLKIFPDILSHFKMPGIVVFVTGTNGKTLSAINISHVLREQGMRVVNNNEGSNMDSGLISKLIKHSSLTGKIKAEAAVLEVDEDAVVKLAKKLRPGYLVVTNIYRDSISRNAHPEFVLRKLRDVPEGITLVLNGDDALSFNLGNEDHKKIYYSVEKAPDRDNKCENLICDVRICPSCHMPIEYEYIQFHHIGRFKCSHCGFEMPEGNVKSSDIDYDNKTFVLNESNGTKTVFPFMTGNLYEVYNNTAIAALCIDLGISAKKVSDAMNTLTSTGGRYEEVRANDTAIISMVGKSQNPISCSQSFAKAKHIEGKKVIIIAINDRVYGGYDHNEDTSWFYDTDFEFLVSDDVLQYIIVGPRMYDTALRLILAGADKDKILLTEKYDMSAAKMVDYDAVKGGSILYFFEVYFREWSVKMKEALLKEAKSHEAN
ncbi:MAG: DUF1727 domain-containing protein [Anaerofustis stercorihominis]|nr:DUF1727 domain-containing protein [Anaerofustis stercorihominis]